MNFKLFNYKLNLIEFYKGMKFLMIFLKLSNLNEFYEVTKLIFLKSLNLNE